MELAESLEVKVMNCKDLKSDIFISFLQKPSIHVVAAVVRDKGPVVEHDDDDFQYKQQQRTPKVVKDDDGGLEWNNQMRFHLDGEACKLQQDLFLRFDLRSEFGGILHHVLGDRSVGQVRVPLKDLIQESVGGITRFASYEIRATDGKPIGVLNFSFKLLLNYTEDKKVLMTSPDGDKQHHHHHHHMVPSPPSSSSSSTSEEKHHHPPPTKSGSESQYRPPLYQLEQLDPSSFQETSLAPLPAMLYPPHHPGYYYPPFPGAPGFPPPALPFSPPPPPPPPPVPYPSSLTHHAPLHPPPPPPHAIWDPPVPPYGPHGLEEGSYGQIGGRGGRAVRWHSHHLPQ